MPTKWLPSFILNEDYDELGVVLTDSYTKIFSESLVRRRRLIWGEMASFFAALSIGILTLCLDLDYLSIYLFPLSGNCALLGIVLVYIQYRFRIPKILCVSKVYSQYHLCQFDLETTYIYKTRKYGARPDNLSLFDLPKSEINDKLEKIDSNITDLDEELELGEAIENIYKTLEKTKKRSVRAPFISRDDSILNELITLIRKMSDFNSQNTAKIYFLPADPPEAVDIGNIINDFRTFMQESSLYDRLLLKINQEIDGHLQKACRIIDSLYSVKSHNIIQNAHTQSMDLGELESISRSLSQMFNITISQLKSDIKASVEEIEKKLDDGIARIQDNHKNAVEEINKETLKDERKLKEKITGLKANITSKDAEISRMGSELDHKTSKEERKKMGSSV
jgi:hypothetical protein